MISEVYIVKSRDGRRDIEGIKIIPLGGLENIGMKSLGSGLRTITLPASLKRASAQLFHWCRLTEIICLAPTAPELYGTYYWDQDDPNPFYGIKSENGVFKYPAGSDYSTWLKHLPEGWVSEEI